MLNIKVELSKRNSKRKSKKTNPKKSKSKSGIFVTASESGFGSNGSSKHSLQEDMLDSSFTVLCLGSLEILSLSFICGILDFVLSLHEFIPVAVSQEP